MSAHATNPVTRLCLALSLGLQAVSTLAETHVAFIAKDAVNILRDGTSLLDIKPIYWGPKWKFVGLSAVNRAEGLAGLFESSGTFESAAIRFEGRIAPSGTRRLDMEFSLRADRDTPATMGILSMNVSSDVVARTVVTRQDGSTQVIQGGYGRNGLGKQIAELALFGPSAEVAHLRFDPPADIASDGAARIVLAHDMLPGNTPRSLRISLELPGDLTFYASTEAVPFEPGFDTWYTWQPTYAYDTPSVLAMDGWLDKPAGRLGRIRREGDTLKTGDLPIRLWGLNLCFGACVPDKDLADKRARFYARYGVNAVRFHKYAEHAGKGGVQSDDSFMEFDPDSLDRMDYQIAQFKKHGIYTKLSAHFGRPKLGVGDKALVPYLEEFGKLAAKPGARVQIPASGVYYGRALQDVQIAHYVNLLRHRNPHTGLTYAEDPAIAFIEILNEQSILFYTSMGPLKASATLRRETGARFCDWLRAKYGSHAGLVASWGKGALNSFGGEGFATSGEHLDAGTILPLGNPWFWDPDNLNGSQAFRRRRLLDSMVFLASLQDEFNARFVAAVRATGYAGEIVASNWQAGRSFSHYLNLHSDALVGTVDRHNYFGGMGNTMLHRPGTGMLGAGMQQVAGHPFMLSEWIHTRPNEFGVEGPAILGAYGMGLQGWDVSFMFQNKDNGGFSEAIGRDEWDVTAPQVLGLFPAVARQVLRGDVRTAELVVPRYVHVPSLGEGRIGFDDRVEQKGDVKEFSGGTVPTEALAVARCVVEFTDKDRETPSFDLSPHVEGSAFRSSTGELLWTRGDSRQAGHFTIDTDGTQAVVGFAEGTTARLKQATITPRTRFAAIYVTAAQPGARVADADTLLVTTIARARNTGAKVVGDTLLDNGKAPILMEPVRAELQLMRGGTPKVWVLDHDGRRTGMQVEVRDGSVLLDGARYKTPYYEIDYEP